MIPKPTPAHVRSDPGSTWQDRWVPPPVSDIFVPRPDVTCTDMLTPITLTVPSATNTPNTPLLGPAKKRVPRMAMRPNGERTAVSLSPSVGA